MALTFLVVRFSYTLDAYILRRTNYYSDLSTIIFADFYCDVVADSEFIAVVQCDA